jgi:hypothetical protein
MVEALIVVIGRYGWSQSEPRPPAPASIVEAAWQSHDDLSHPLRVAGHI